MTNKDEELTDIIANAVTYQYTMAIRNLADKFVNTYYNYGDNDKAFFYFIGDSKEGSIGRKYKLSPGPLCISEDIFWNIGNVWEALYHGIPKDILLQWKDYEQDFWMSHKKDQKETNPINLVNWYRGERKYTEEDRAKSQEKIKEIYKQLDEEIEKNKIEEYNAKEEREKKDMLYLAMAVSVYDVRKALQEYDREHILDNT